MEINPNDSNINHNLSPDKVDFSHGELYTHDKSREAKNMSTESNFKLLRGFQDFLPERMIPRVEMISRIKGVCEIFGFMPQDTPILEDAALLLGKYGEEEKLIYKFEDRGGRNVAMRYDLTVPLARVVAMNLNKLSLPYKRYQFGMVWRAEKPQKGRFREFMQFDADIVGTKSEFADSEVVAMMHATMEEFGVDYRVKINNRLILNGLLRKLGVNNDEGHQVMMSIDKFDKVGIKGVGEELKRRGFSDQLIGNVVDYLKIGGDGDKVLERLETFFKKDEEAQAGIDNLRFIKNSVNSMGFDPKNLIIDPTIARGLDYYTGVIYETKLTALPNFGSVCGGGRFDKLIGNIVGDGNEYPAVGTSFGVDRLFAALIELGKIEAAPTKTQVAILNLDSELSEKYSSLIGKLRHSGISVEFNYNSESVKKQLKRMANLHIPFVVFLGKDELTKQGITIKNMEDGSQVFVEDDRIVNYFKDLFVK